MRAIGTRITGIMLLLFCLGTTTHATQSSPGVLITEVSPHELEFVELYNPTEHIADLQGFWLCYYPANRDSWEKPFRKKQFPDGAVIRPHAYYLIAFGETCQVDSLTVDWCVYQSKQLKALLGTVAVFEGRPSKNTLVDAVGWGETGLYFGDPAPSPSKGMSVSRRPGKSHLEVFRDTQNNLSDFSIEEPAPSSNKVGTVLFLSQKADSVIDKRGIEWQVTVCSRSVSPGIFKISLDNELGLRTNCSACNQGLGPGECAKASVQVDIGSGYDFYTLDLETSGFSAEDNQIIEIGWAHYCGEEVVQTFSSLVHFDGQLNPAITYLTGITSEELRQAPLLTDVLPGVLEELHGSPVVVYSHNRFDQRFLSSAAERLDLDTQALLWIDAYKWAREAFPLLESHTLAQVAKDLEIGSQQHRALADALMAGDVFVQSLKRLGSEVHISVHVTGSDYASAASSVFLDASVLLRTNE